MIIEANKERKKKKRTVQSSETSSSHGAASLLMTSHSESVRSLPTTLSTPRTTCPVGSRRSSYSFPESLGALYSSQSVHTPEVNKTNVQ